MKKLIKLRQYVQFDLYTVDNIYVIQLFDKNVYVNDGKDCIWEDSDKNIKTLLKRAIEWCENERIYAAKEQLNSIHGINSVKPNREEIKQLSSITNTCIYDIESYNSAFAKLIQMHKNQQTNITYLKELYLKELC